MASLVLHQDLRTFKVLRSFLDSYPGHVLTSANDVNEAVGFLMRNRDRTRSIFMDFDQMGQAAWDLFEKMQSSPFLRDCAWIGMGAPLIRQSTLPKVDAWLTKPFGARGFGQALDEAMQSKGRHRDTLMLIKGGESFEEQKLNQALSTHGGHWKRLIRVASREDFFRELSIHSARLGGVLVDPLTYHREAKDWFRGFARSVQGKRTVFGVLSRVPLEVGDLRCHGHFFVQGNSLTLFGANELLLRMSRRLICLAQVERAVQQGSDLQERANLLERIDPHLLEYQVARAGVLLDLGEYESASRCCEAILQLNPYLPRAHWILMKAAQALQLERAKDHAQLALHHCPRHLGVVEEANKILGSYGSSSDGFSRAS